MKILRFLRWGFKDMDTYTMRTLTFCMVGLGGLLVHSPYWMLGGLFCMWLDFMYQIFKDRWEEFTRVENEKS